MVLKNDGGARVPHEGDAVRAHQAVVFEGRGCGIRSPYFPV